MDTGRWRKITELLELTLEVPPKDRFEVLTALCRDPGIRAEVEALLKLEDDLAGFVEEPVFHIHGEPPKLLRPGTPIGRYRTIRELGQGGMGRVFLAERSDGEVEHRVAIKILKRGLDTDEIVERFQRERQILASLSENSSIARFIDSGVSDDGLPYYVMEYIEGEPISTYCERHSLGLGERLALFQDACAAVRYAHQHLIVHRDLKPSNILVSDTGDLKLLDFGIAKLLDPEGTSTYATCGDWQFRTPESASPEQILGGQITTATDVYSLGVLLYALLTGRQPFPASGRTRRQVERTVCEVEPERPSGLAGDLGVGRELDLIVQKAMHKDFSRRYSSVGDLASDIERLLAGLPVAAAGDSRAYRLRKHARRHWRWLAAAAALMVVALAYGATATVLQRNAQRQRLTAERTSDFIQEILTQARPDRSQGASLTVREVLDTTRQRIAVELRDEPEVQTELLDTTGRAYLALGLYDDARSLFEESLRLRRSLFGERHLLVAESLHSLASVQRDLGDLRGAATSLEEAIAIQRDKRSADHPLLIRGLHNLATLLEELGDYAEAERRHRSILELKKEVLGTEHPDVATSLQNLAKVVLLLERPSDAEALYRESLKLRRAHYGLTSPEVGRTLNSLGAAVEAQGRLEEAEELYRRALAVRTQVYPDSHPEVAVSLNNLAKALVAQGDLETPEALYRRALAICDRFLAEGHPTRGAILRNFAALRIAAGDHEAGERLAREAFEIFERAYEPEHWRAADARSVLGAALAGLGELPAAESELVAAYRQLLERRGASAPPTVLARSRLLDFLQRTGQADRAAQFR